MHVVRHGQAQFLTDDYDRLSELGQEQARELGRYWLAAKHAPDQVYAGSLRRQQHTAQLVAQMFEQAGESFPQLQTLEGLNEYPAEKIMEVLVPVLTAQDADIRARELEVREAQDDRAKYRSIHRLLEAVMARWVANEYPSGLGLPTWVEFSGGVREAFSKIRADAPRGSRIAVFTSGGPVGISVQTTLNAPQIVAAELNWRVINASVSAFTFSDQRIVLDRFNDVAHLAQEQITYR